MCATIWLGVALGMIWLIFNSFSVKLRVRRAVAIAPTHDDHSGISPAVSGHSHEGSFASDRGGDLIVCYTDAPGGWRSGRKKVACRPYGIVADGLRGETQMEVSFSFESSRTEGQTEVLLKVDQIDCAIKTRCKGGCGLEDSLCGRNSGRKYDEFFIKKMTVQVCPAQGPDAWAQGCQHLVLEPQVTPQECQLQQSSSLAFQIPFLNPRAAFITYQAGSTTGRQVASFAWGPASSDSDWNVTWPWELSRFDDGTKIRFNKTYWGSRPQLGFQPASLHIRPGALPGVSACWHLPYNAELQMPQPVWDMTIITETAVVRKNLLAGHCVTEGPIFTYKERLAFV